MITLSFPRELGGRRTCMNEAAKSGSGFDYEGLRFWVEELTGILEKPIYAYDTLRLASRSYPQSALGIPRKCRGTLISWQVSGNHVREAGAKWSGPAHPAAAAKFGRMSDRSPGHRIWMTIWQISIETRWKLLPESTDPVPESLTGRSF